MGELQQIHATKNSEYIICKTDIGTIIIVA